jgi:hypothetical protein
MPDMGIERSVKESVKLPTWIAVDLHRDLVEGLVAAGVEHREPEAVEIVE